MDVADAKRLRALEEENRRPKQIVADLCPNKVVHGQMAGILIRFGGRFVPMPTREVQELSAAASARFRGRVYSRRMRPRRRSSRRSPRNRGRYSSGEKLGGSRAANACARGFAGQKRRGCRNGVSAPCIRAASNRD